MADEKTNEQEVKDAIAPVPKAPPVTPVVSENTDEKVAESAAIPEVIETEQVEVLPYTDLKPGMIVRVHEKIKDTNSKGEEKERVQVFEGIIMGLRGGNTSRTATVRKNSKGWMVEKIYPLSSPNIEKIEVVKRFRVRRAKLSYLRDVFKRKLKEIK